MSIIEAIIGPVSQLLDTVIPDPRARARAKLELIKLQGDQEMAAIGVQMRAIVAEAQSADPWTSRARPSFLYVMYAIILWALPMGLIAAFDAKLASGIGNGMTAYLRGLRRSSTLCSAPAISATRRRGPGGRSRASSARRALAGRRGLPTWAGMNRETKTPRRGARKPALAASLLALTGCTPAGLLTQVDRLVSGGAAQRVAEGERFGPDPRQRLDVWAPAAAKGKGAALPIVLFFYGGGWNAGSRGDFGFAGAAYAGQGFIAIVPDYRLVPQVRFPDFVEDGALAVKWARDNAARFGGDPRRITLAGHSAGAYNAAMLALDTRFLKAAGVDPGIVRAAALLSGPYDFYPFTESRGRAAFGEFSNPLETQPVRFVRADAPPLFLAHGSNDRVVLPRNSRNLAERLKQAGAPATLRIYPGVAHVDMVAALSAPFRGRLPVLEESAAFLERHSR
jgi:acetyl esterase/lipase